MKSTEIIKPAALVAPLAFNGTKNSIPDSATGTNAASVAEGFPAVTSLPKSEGGLPPARADFNGMFYLSTDQKVYLQNGGILTFSKDVSDAIGGYPKGAILDCFDAKNNTFSKVQSLIDDNTYNFVETPSYINDEYWKLLNFGGANVALSNISDVGLDKLNQSKAMETGNVSNDADVYPYILEYAHSTFDKSKFTISGSPTISDNGIASGFSASNYIRVTLNIPKITSSFLIKGKATVGTLGGKPQQLFLLNNNCRAELSLDGSELIFFSGDFTSNVNLAIRFKTPLKQSDVLEYTFSLDVSTGKIKADALVNNTDNYDASKDFTLNPETTAITLMQVSPVGYLWAGSIDLNKIVIFADGNGYFNGNIDGKDTIDGIEIPYVLSKTGSKIVGVAYRDKVQQLYEQTGEALYYTIDEENKNFTLPMGEIYGMISSHVLDIVYQIGEPIPSLTNSLKSNEIWLEGAVVSRITYAKLFEVYGTTYGAGDGSATFGLPDLRNRVLWGSADASRGYIQAGLPNITGYFEGVASYEDHNGGSGALFYTKSGYSTTLGHANLQYLHTWANVNIDASRSSSIYGASTTVQPPAIKVRYKTRFI